MQAIAEWDAGKDGAKTFRVKETTRKKFVISFCFGKTLERPDLLQKEERVKQNGGSSCESNTKHYFLEREREKESEKKNCSVQLLTVQN